MSRRGLPTAAAALVVCVASAHLPLRSVAAAQSGEGDDRLVTHGRFENLEKHPIAGASVYQLFLGDPPRNSGTAFNLTAPSGRTDEAGRFKLVLSDLDEKLAAHGPPGAWRRGCFLVVAVRDSRTLGYTISSGEELLNSEARLLALPLSDIRGTVLDETWQPIADAEVEADRYFTFVGRGPVPFAPINFWLYRAPGGDAPLEARLRDLVARTGADGSFVIPRAPQIPGGLRLLVSHPGFARAQTPWHPQQSEIILRMRPGASVFTRIALPDDGPAVGFRLHLEGAPDGDRTYTHRWGETDKAGQWALSGLPPGTYTIRFLGSSAPRWALPALPVPELHKGEKREISATAVRGSVLCGRVLQSGTKAPIYRAEVRFQSEAYPRTGSTIQAAYTDAEGRFEFKYPIVPGPLDVAVSVSHQGKRIGRRHKIVVRDEPRTEAEFLLPVQ